MRNRLVAASILLALTAPAAMADPVGVTSTAVSPSWDASSDVSMNVGIGNEWFNNIHLEWTASTDPNSGQTVYTLAGGPIILTTSDSLGELRINSAFFDPDPLLLFSASATNSGSTPLAYSFSFNTPLSPVLTGTINSHAELGVTLTDGANDGATVQPLAGDAVMLKSFDLFAGGGSISKNVDIGTAFSVFATTGGTTYSKDSTLVCTQACVTMSARLSFTLTAQDAVAFTGKVVQTSEVPLPGALWMLGSGLLGLGGLRRRRTSSPATAA